MERFNFNARVSKNSYQPLPVFGKEETRARLFLDFRGQHDGRTQARKQSSLKKQEIGGLLPDHETVVCQLIL